METSRSLLGALKHWAAFQPDKTLHIFVDDRGAEVERLTYRQLLERSTILAAKLLDPASHGMQSGDRALLVFPPCLDFIVAFYACLLAGMVAVPVFPPDPRGKGGKEVALFAAVVRTSGATIALTSKSYNLATKLGGFKRLFSGSEASGSSSSGLGAWPEHLKWMVVDEMAHGERVLSIDYFPTNTKEALQAVADADASGTNRSQPAFLQFTSGSTSEPKGVIISHGNLAHNLSLIIDGLQASEDTVVVSWLPLYHDMGLIGSYLGALYCGGSGVYMSPMSFIRHPPLWLELISKHRGTHMQAPNFAYGLAARKFLALPGRDRRRLDATLDLSSVRHMINAAEPVRQADMELFKATFEKHGLPPRGVIFPTYGLAEHTVFVCTNGSQVLSLDRQQLEAHGKAVLVDSASSANPGSAAAVQARKQSGGDEGNEGSANSAATAAVTVVGCGYPGQAKGVDLKIVQHASVGKKEGKSNGDNGSSVIDEFENTASSSLGVEVEGEDWVGEIWVKSDSRAEGYWNDEEKTKQDFGGELKRSNDDDSSSSTSAKRGYLRTGDLGFLHNGELFVCGRVKDLIICNGANLYPQDIERAAEDSCSILRGGCSAAFSLPPLNNRNQRGGQSVSSASTTVQGSEVQEALFLVAEVTDAATKDLTLSDYAASIASLRATVSSSTGAALDGVFLLAPRTVPKTTSGKIARQWCKRGLKDGTLEVIYEWFDYSRFNGAKSNNNHDTIANIVPDISGPEKVHVSSESNASSQSDGESRSSDGNSAGEMSEAEVLEVIVEAVAVTVLRVDPSSIDPHAPVPSLGLGSMEGVQVLNILERRFGVTLPNEILFEEETTLARLVPLIRAGGGVGVRACLVDAAHIAAKEVAGQTEEQRTSKLRTATVKSSWRDGSLPVDCLLPKATATSASAALLVNDAFRDAVVSNAWRLACFLIGGGAAGLGVRAVTGRSSPLSSSSAAASSTIMMAEDIANGGGDASTSVGSIGLAPLWILLIIVGALVALAASLATRRMQRYLLNSSKSGNNNKAFLGTSSARAQVCAYLGSKVLYEEPLDPLDGPYLVCAFPPAPVLAASSASAASAALNLTQSSQSSAAALEVLTSRAAETANKERAEYRVSAAQQVASEVNRFGGLPLAAGGPPHEAFLADAAALAEQSGSSGGGSQLGSVSGCAAVIGLFPRSGNGSVAMLGAAAVQGGLFGPMMADASAGDKESGGATVPVSLLRSPVDLACLSGVLPPGGSGPVTSEAAAIFAAAANAPPPLAIVALAPLLGLPLPASGSTAVSGLSKKAAAARGGAAVSTTLAAEAAVSVLKRGGTVFYGASISASGHGAVQAALAPAVTRDAGVMAAAAVARDVGAACAVAVRAAMRHGASLVPCLVLGDDDVNTQLFQDSALGWATGFSGEKARSAAHAVQGGAAPSMLGAAAMALSSLMSGNHKKDNKSQSSSSSGRGDGQQLSTCAVYGRPISVPHTSSPHPKVVAAYAAEYLTALAALEEKYAPLHPSH